MALDETLTDGQTGHVAFHEAIHGLLNDRLAAYVQHGATAGTARPDVAGSAAAVALWDGSVAPSNGVAGDFWWDTTGDLWKRYDGSSWVSASGTLLGETEKLQVTDATSAGASDIIQNPDTNTIGAGYDVVVVLGGTDANPQVLGSSISLAVIGGGYGNEITQGIASTIVGGAQHQANASGGHTFIGGGSTNVTSGDYSVVAGGLQNQATALYAAVCGGRTNTADGADSFIGGGQSNDCNGSYSTIGGGFNNTASGLDSTIAGGDNNVTSGGGTQGAIGGGQQNQVTAAYGSVAGGYKGKASLYGQRAHAAGSFSTDGDAQISDLLVRRSTSDATQSELFLDGASSRMTVPSDTTWAFSIMVAARRTDADNESAAYKIEGCIDNNAGTTALVGTISKTVLAEDTAAWDVTVEADDTNDALVVKATGEASKTIRWLGRVELVQVAG